MAGRENELVEKRVVLLTAWCHMLENKKRDVTAKEASIIGKDQEWWKKTALRIWLSCMARRK